MNNLLKLAIIGGLAFGVFWIYPYAVTTFQLAKADTTTPAGLVVSRDTFVISCASVAEKEAAVAELDLTKDDINQYCGCVFDDALSQLGQEGFNKMNEDYDRTNVFTPEMNEIINTCVQRVFL